MYHIYFVLVIKHCLQCCMYGISRQSQEIKDEAKYCIGLGPLSSILYFIANDAVSGIKYFHLWILILEKILSCQCK